MNESSPVALEEMRAARELRAARQTQLLRQHRLPMLSFTLNIPGPQKRSAVADAVFLEGKRRILSTLRALSLPLCAAEQYDEHSGRLLLAVVDCSAKSLKQEMVLLEEADELARLFDIDVLDAQGNKLSRSDLNLPGRRCFLCDRPAQACARSRAHALEELDGYITLRIRTFFEQAAVERCAGAAVRALLYEVTAAPKPGLVDRLDNGAHHDMNIFTFLDSAVALLPYFRDAVILGIHGADERKETFAKLRARGRLAEGEMLYATNGVNTHKGLIFSLGILCCAYGVLWKQQAATTPEALAHEGSRLAADAIRQDLAQAGGRTNGEAIFRAHRISGVRGEVLAGFPAVLQHGLPALRQRLHKGASLEAAAVIALLHMIGHLSDTNLIHRSSVQQLSAIQSRLRQVCAQANDAELLILAEDLNLQWSKLGISPGGSADLLAITLFFYFLEQGADSPSE